MTSAYYRGAVGALVVYDITNRQSFINAETWLNELKNSVVNRGEVKLVLVGNKSDLDHIRAVGTEEGREWAQRMGMGFWETSALDGSGVEEVFSELLRRELFFFFSRLRRED